MAPVEPLTSTFAAGRQLISEIKITEVEMPKMSSVITGVCFVVDVVRRMFVGVMRLEKSRYTSGSSAHTEALAYIETVPQGALFAEHLQYRTHGNSRPYHPLS